MQDKWILDVLADLRSYATSREYRELAEHLSDMSIKASEILTRGTQAEIIPLRPNNISEREVTEEASL